MDKYKNQLLNYISSLDWNRKGVQDQDIEHGHPFKEVFDALSIMKTDLDSVFEKRNKAEKKLRNGLEKMIDLRTRELEEEIIKKNYVKKINASIINISTAVNTAQSLDALYPIIHKALNEILEMPNLYIGIYHKEKDMIRVPYNVDQYDGKITEIKHIAKSRSLVSEVVLNQKPLLLEKQDLIERSKDIENPGPVPENWLGIPLICQDKTIGIMVIQSYTASNYFNNKNLEALISVSNQVALAIERRQALDHLHEREEKYRKLIETTSAGYWQLDENDKTVAVNQALCNMIGYEAQEILGKKPYVFYSNQSKKEYKKLLEQKAQIYDRSFEITFVKKNKQLLHSKIDLAPIFDAAGLFKGSFAFMSDISEQKKAEKNLINETRRANEMAMAAEAANQAKSEFLANMSHEIRTPINGVMGMAEILMDSTLDENQKNYIRIINVEADSLLRIINQVLDFSKIEAGKMELEEIGFDLRKMFEDISETISIRADKKGLGFLSFLDTDIPNDLKGDPGRLRQIFMNLAGNALKFTSKGEIFIKGKKISETAEQMVIRFEIKDTGVGIPLEKQSSIFDSFSQADGSTSRKYGGTGLGTTISKQLVELMGGQIGLESEQGKGTKFWFAIDFKKQEPKISCKSEAVIDLKNLTIILIDTHKTHQYIISKYLAAFGCDVVMAETGKQALEILENHKAKTRIDLVLTDFYVSKTNGFEVAQMIRKIKAFDTIPIVLMTSAGIAGDGKRCREIGIQGYLSKPVRKKELQMAIASVLGRVAGPPGHEDRLVTRHSIQEPCKKEFRILVVEDYPTNQQIALKHLTNAGFKVTLAENGVQAVSIFKKAQFDLILMDIQMPEMDGYEATKKIRQIEQYISKDLPTALRTPVVAITAHAMKDYRQNCIQADMDDYLTKPLKRKDLIFMVEKWASPNQDNVCSGLPEEKNTPKRIELQNREEAGSLPIDMARALDEFDNDTDFLNEVLGEFLEHVEEQLPLIRTAVGTQDFDIIEKQGHAIKGGAANLTAMNLSRAAFELEKVGKEQNPNRMEKVLNTLVSEYEILFRYVKPFRRTVIKQPK